MRGRAIMGMGVLVRLVSSPCRVLSSSSREEIFAFNAASSASNSFSLTSHSASTAFSLSLKSVRSALTSETSFSKSAISSLRSCNFSSRSFSSRLFLCSGVSPTMQKVGLSIIGLPGFRSMGAPVSCISSRCNVMCSCLREEICAFSASSSASKSFSFASKSESVASPLSSAAICSTFEAASSSSTPSGRITFRWRISVSILLGSHGRPHETCTLQTPGLRPWKS
mmetsp:Transcript_19774/g.36087  ORF Transcript_19774/g.36087 Transcript_19774/m.36087 type:complete len:225 (-) Transcript_19774:301-975(-)